MVVQQMTQIIVVSVDGYRAVSPESSYSEYTSLLLATHFVLPCSLQATDRHDVGPSS